MEKEKPASTSNASLDIGKLPETKTGIKLKQKLLQDDSVQNVKSMRKV